MKFTCTQENFNRGLLVVSHIANKNATLPILNNVLIKAENGSVKLDTTNLEMAVAVNLRGKIESSGIFTAQAKLLADFVSLLPKENVEIELEDQNLNVKCGNYQTVIRGMDASEFPLVPEVDKTNYIKVETQVLKKALQRVVFTVTLDEARPEISGVLFIFDEKSLTVVGTDSYRLSEARVNLIQGLKQGKEIIVPLRTIQEVIRIISEVEELEVKIFVEESQILFKIGEEVELTSRLIEGQYPDYKQIIPQETKTKAKVNVGELIKIIKSASLFCKPGINDVKLAFLPDKNEIVISSLNASVGENLVNLSVECKGEENEAVFNYRYILEGLSNLNSDEAEIKLISSSSPGIIKPHQDDGYLYIIMPIRQ